jgi:hypothetical protein
MFQNGVKDRRHGTAQQLGGSSWFTYVIDIAKKVGSITVPVAGTQIHV